MVLLAIAAAGWHASRTANAGLQTVYDDRVKPLRDLKVVADLYAVNIVDAAHKVRNGNFDWNAGLAAVEDAEVRLAKHWQAYIATRMDDKEKKLADEAASTMRSGAAVARALVEIIKAKDRPGLDRFVIDTLYPAIDPISEAIGKLIDLQIDEAQAQYQVSSTAFANARLAMIVTLVAAPWRWPSRCGPRWSACCGRSAESPA